MHAALKIPHILAEIFNCFYFLNNETDPPNDETDYRSSLAGALTCKAFLSPALDVIWRHLVDLVPLFSTIPNLQSFVDSDEITQLYADVPLSLSDIETMRGYARRVRSLVLVHHDKYPVDNLLAFVDPVLLTQLLTLLEKDHLFPRLKSLVIELRVDDVVKSSSHFSLFLSPSLQKLEFEPIDIPLTWDFRTHTSSLWTFLQMQANLPSQQLYSLKTCFTLSNSTIQCLPKFSSLLALKLDDCEENALDFQSLKTICKIPSLRTLSLSLAEAKSKRNVAIAGPKPVFLNLSSLTLFTDTSTALLLFTCFRFPRLSNLKLYYHFPSKSTGAIRNAWSQLSILLADELPTLASLKLSMADNILKDRTPSSWSNFSPLYRLPITNIDICGRSVHSLTNTDIGQMALAWPDLKSMAVDTEHQGAIDHRILYTLGQKFLKLESLSLALDLTRFPAFSMMDESKFSVAHGLTSLTISHAPAGSVGRLTTKRTRDIAQTLDTLFPNLDTVWYDGDSRLSSDLSGLVQGLQEARRRERKTLMAQQHNVNELIG